MILKPSIGGQIMAQRKALEALNLEEENEEKLKFQAIEASLTSANEKLAKANKDIAELTAKVTIFQGQLDSRQEQLDKAKTDLTTLESKTNANAFALEDKLAQANARITQEQEPHKQLALQ